MGYGDAAGRSRAHRHHYANMASESWTHDGSKWIRSRIMRCRSPRSQYDLRQTRSGPWRGGQSNSPSRHGLGRAGYPSPVIPRRRGIFATEGDLPRVVDQPPVSGCDSRSIEGPTLQSGATRSVPSIRDDGPHRMPARWDPRNRIVRFRGMTVMRRLMQPPIAPAAPRSRARTSWPGDTPAPSARARRTRPRDAPPARRCSGWYVAAVNVPPRG